MKLFYCKACMDMVRLTKHTKACSCRLSQGRYISKVVVEVEGPCAVFAISDSAFKRALMAANHIVSQFTAFVLDDSCLAIKRVDAANVLAKSNPDA